MIQRSAVFLAAVLAMSAANVQAAIIDMFDSVDQSLKVTRTYPERTDNKQVSTAFGGWRDILLQRVSNQPIYVDVFEDPQDKGLFFSQGTGEAITTLVWGKDPRNIQSISPSANLTSGGDDRFWLNVAAVDGTGIRVKMTVYSSDRALSSATDYVLVQNNGIVEFPYDTFSGDASFLDIDAIVLELNGEGNLGCDIAINSLTTASQTAPEPSTFVLIAIGALGFLGVRRWRRN